jgi:hypothetical protein
MKSHRVERFEEACEDIIMKTHVAFDLGNKVRNKYHYVFYEDLVENPKKIISEIIKWLDLECSDSWLRKISTKVNCYPVEQHRIEYRRIADLLIMKYRADKTFARYI